MSLGLTRDSALDLASLAEEANNRRIATEAKARGTGKTHNVPQMEEGESAEVQLNRTESDEHNHGTNPSSGSGKGQDHPANPSSSSYGQYSGFTVNQNNMDPYQFGGPPHRYDPNMYHPSLLGGNTHKKKKKNVFCCIFAPWAAAKDDDDEEEDGYKGGDKPDGMFKTTTDTDPTTTGRDGRVQAKNAAPTENSSGSIKAAEQEKVDAANTSGGTGNGTENADANKDGTDDKETDENGNKRPKGILKRTSIVANPRSALSDSLRSSTKPQPGSRRSLFPQYEQKPKRTHKHRCHFAPMARVVAVRSLKDMTHGEKADVWWQKKDYDDFKRTGRIIAKAMLEGGSEVWLATNKSWRNGSDGAKSSTRQFTTEGMANAREQNSQDSNKWWHKFGHSRRGLEHIASIDEGRQRQANVRFAIRAVVDEQKRQRIYRKRDAEKLRMLSLQYTSWARDLALAAASADAEAVKGDFQPDRNTREFYILKQAKDNGGFSTQIPTFMLPTVMTPQMLDANTSSQLRFKRKQTAPTTKKETVLSPTKQQQQQQQQQPTPTQNSEASSSSSESTIEAIVDKQLDGDSIAKRAAGFGTESGANMAAVLSGMGTVAAS